MIPSSRLSCFVLRRFHILSWSRTNIQYSFSSTVSSKRCDSMASIRIRFLPAPPFLSGLSVFRATPHRTSEVFCGSAAKGEKIAVTATVFLKTEHYILFNTMALRLAASRTVTGFARRSTFVTSFGHYGEIHGLRAPLSNNSSSSFVGDAGLYQNNGLSNY